jgi:uncharacterized phosphatase
MQGHTDIPLNSAGKIQAQNGINFVERMNIDLIVSSPLIRAKETADIVNTTLKKPVICDLRLQERHYGDFEGRTIEEFNAFRSELAKDPTQPLEENGLPYVPNAEPYDIFRDRIITSIAEHILTHADKTVLFVSHGGVYRMLRRVLIGDLQSSDNVQPWYFEKTDGGWVARNLQETSNT